MTRVRANRDACAYAICSLLALLMLWIVAIVHVARLRSRHSPLRVR